MDLVKLSVGIGGLGQIFCRRERAWLNHPQGSAGLVKPSTGVGRLGQIICRGRRAWLNFLQTRLGLVKLSAGVDDSVQLSAGRTSSAFFSFSSGLLKLSAGVGYAFWRIKHNFNIKHSPQNWEMSYFQQDRAGLVRPSFGAGETGPSANETGHTFCGSKWDCSNFLRTELVKLPGEWEELV